MKRNKNAGLFYNGSEENELIKIAEFLKTGDFEKVISESQKALKQFPSSSMLFAALALGCSGAGKHSDAMRTLKLAEEKFPDNFEILHQLAKLYEEINNFAEAEKYYLRSFAQVPDDLKEVRSFVQNNLGCLYWRQGIEDKAEEHWKKAVMEYPQNINAKKNLEELIYTDSLIPGVKDSVIDDLSLFNKIQIEKYLKLKKKKEFRTLKESKRIIEIIVKVFNEKFYRGVIDLDSLTIKEKKKLFKDTVINF